MKTSRQTLAICALLGATSAIQDYYYNEAARYEDAPAIKSFIEKADINYSTGSESYSDSEYGKAPAQNAGEMVQKPAEAPKPIEAPKPAVAPKPAPAAKVPTPPAPKPQEKKAEPPKVEPKKTVASAP